MKLIFIAILLTSCGVQVDDIEVKPSQHEVVHRVVFDTTVEQYENECVFDDDLFLDDDINLCVRDKIVDRINELELTLNEY